MWCLSLVTSPRGEWCAPQCHFAHHPTPVTFQDDLRRWTQVEDCPPQGSQGSRVPTGSDVCSCVGPEDNQAEPVIEGTSCGWRRRPDPCDERLSAHPAPPTRGGLQFRAGLSLSPSSTECVGRSTLAHLRFCSSLNPWLSFFPCPPLWSPRSQEAFLILFQPCISVLWTLLCLHYFLCSHFLREKINPLSPSPDYKLLEVGGPFLLILVAPSRSSTVFGTSCWRTFHLWKKKSNSNPVLLPACVFKIVTALKCTDGMWHCILFSIFTPIPCIPTPEPSHHFFHFICYCPGNRCFSNCRI